MTAETQGLHVIIKTLFEGYPFDGLFSQHPSTAQLIKHSSLKSQQWWSPRPLWSSYETCVWQFVCGRKLAGCLPHRTATDLSNSSLWSRRERRDCLCLGWEARLHHRRPSEKPRVESGPGLGALINLLISPNYTVNWDPMAIWRVVNAASFCALRGRERRKEKRLRNSDV